MSKQLVDSMYKSVDKKSKKDIKYFNPKKMNIDLNSESKMCYGNGQNTTTAEK